jgi:hypothetical protein
MCNLCEDVTVNMRCSVFLMGMYYFVHFWKALSPSKAWNHLLNRHVLCMRRSFFEPAQPNPGEKRNLDFFGDLMGLNFTNA